MTIKPNAAPQEPNGPTTPSQSPAGAAPNNAAPADAMPEPTYHTPAFGPMDTILMHIDKNGRWLDRSDYDALRQRCEMLQATVTGLCDKLIIAEQRAKQAEAALSTALDACEDSERVLAAERKRAEQAESSVALLKAAVRDLKKIKSFHRDMDGGLTKKQWERKHAAAIKEANE